MRADTPVDGSATQRSRATSGDEVSLAELISELAKAGLVSAEVGDDGAVEYALTSQGAKVAQQMAMTRHAHALVLLGALAGSSESPN